MCVCVCVTVVGTDGCRYMEGVRNKRERERGREREREGEGGRENTSLCTHTGYNVYAVLLDTVVVVNELTIPTM